MRNIALFLTYLGTHYHGWQVQKNLPTVAETMEKAAAMVVGHPVHMTGCGRTDAGVHARVYVANFRTSSTIPVERLPYALNTHLPCDIRAWFYPRHLDENVMQAAASQFVGTHDFAAVRSVGTDVKSTVRTVYYYNVERQGELVTLRVCANGFLYNMARAMAGTVVYAAEGKIRPEEIGEILASGNRTAAGPTVPAGGLYMTRLWYDDGIEKFEVGSDGNV